MSSESYTSDDCELCGNFNNDYVVCKDCYEEIIGLLEKVTANDRDIEEGDCVFCGCERGSGDDETGNCYSDCVMIEVRKLLSDKKKREDAIIKALQLP